MSNVSFYHQYLTKKYKDINMSSKSAGPVITISRETGCFAWTIAEQLTKRINEEYKNNDKPWHWVSKEILEKSAEELNMNPEEIEHIFEGKSRGILDNLAQSFFNYYKSDDSIISTIKHIIKSIAYDGNVIIVGRAGSIITKDIHRSLHIKLYAPFEYRVNALADYFKLNNKDATNMLKETDKKREAFLKFMAHNKPENEYYDLLINRTKYDDDSLIELILFMAEQKKLF